MQTHILSGWCAASLFPLTAREWLFCMAAASVADVDGLGLLLGSYGQELYWKWHHTLGHNLFFGLLAAGALAAFSTRRATAFILYLGLFHLHLYMDYWGSGPDWHIHYLWPASAWVWKNPRAWAFYSWQNMLVFLLFLVWTLWVAVRQGRTPLEAWIPSLDRDAVRWLRNRARRPWPVTAKPPD